MNFLKLHDVHQKLLAQAPVAETELHAAGFSPPVLDAAKQLGLNWQGLLQLFIQYGPQLLSILLTLVAGKNPAPAPTPAPVTK